MSETLRWTKERVRFTDHSRGFKTDGPGEYDVPADVAERYLSHRSDGWERVTDEPDTTETDDDTCLGNDGECSRTTPTGSDYCWQHEP